MKDIDWVKIITLLLAIAGFAKVIYEYIKTQNWKKAEFLAKEIKEMKADIAVQRAFKMLDWNGGSITLKPNEILKTEGINFNDSTLSEALLFHEIKIGLKGPGDFSIEEEFIRDTFDAFFERLSTLQNYIDSKLFSKDDLKPYLIYYLEIIADPANDRKPVDLKQVIWDYLVNYRYNQVIKLFTAYGFSRPF